MSTAISTGAEDSWRWGAVIVAEGEVCFLQPCKDGSSDDVTKFTTGLLSSVNMDFKMSEGVD